MALKREKPARTATQITRILRTQAGWAPSDRTLQRHFARLELDRELEAEPQAFGRFEATRCNELWTGDALHGPVICGQKAYLFAFLDDRSRAVMAARFGFSEDTVRLAAALRPALASRGVPESIYVDNGSAFVDSWLLRACAVLGIKLVHSQPGRPEGRGKIERFFRTVREQFLVEITAEVAAAITSLAELNRLFTAWAETVYHARPHSETGAAPLRRWQEGIPVPLPLPSPAQLREAFLWSEYRTVTKTATVSLHGNTYQVDHLLAGRKAELVFDPFDLEDIEACARCCPAWGSAPSAQAADATSRPATRQPARRAAGSPRTPRHQPRWSCRCPARRCYGAPRSTPAARRPRGKPCLAANGTVVPDRPWPPGKAHAEMRGTRPRGRPPGWT